LDDLLLPIPGDDPCGGFVRNSRMFLELKEARREDDKLPVGVWQSDRKQADPEKVEALAREMLASQSKDLLVAAWLCEALLRQHGRAVLAELLGFLEKFSSTFGAGLHPRAEGDDFDPQVLVYDWLDDRLSLLLQLHPITEAWGAKGLRFSLDEYRNALRTEGEARTARGKTARPAILADFRSATGAMPSRSLIRHLTEVEGADGALDSLKSMLDARFGNEAPSLSGLRDTLDGLAHWARSELDARGIDPHGTDPVFVEEESAADEAAAADAPKPVRSLPIADRRDAYRRLSEISSYLNRVEPHSPTPYLLNRIVEWQDIPLPDLLVELARGRRDIVAVFELLGFVKEGA
jgi:type VI secretion system ImpA family protein